MHLDGDDHANFGGHNGVSLEIHLEAIVERVWRYALGRP